MAEVCAFLLCLFFFFFFTGSILTWHSASVIIAQDKMSVFKYYMSQKTVKFELLIMQSQKVNLLSSTFHHKQF